MAATSRRSYNGPVLRSVSPTRRLSSPSITFYSSPRFNLDRTTSSPKRSISHSQNKNQAVMMSKNPSGPVQRRSCMCSPTNHPGSFRCSLHKSNSLVVTVKTPPYCPNKLRRSAMVNSVVRIGTVEGVDMVKRSLAALIRPSSHQLRRREIFQRRSSRLSRMSKMDN